MTHVVGGAKKVVLIVGARQDDISTEFRQLVTVRNHWEIQAKSAMPSGLRAVCVLGDVARRFPAAKDRIAGFSKGLHFAELSPDEDVNVWLGAWLEANAESLGLEVVTAGASPPPSEDDNPSSEGGPASELTAQELLEAFTVPTSRIRPQKGQPRSYFNSDKLAKLEASIAQRGQLQPLLVKRVAGDPFHDYEVIDGERRLRVCLKLKRPTTNVVVRFVDNADEQFMLSFVANFSREDHTIMEKARAIGRAMKSPAYANLSQTARLEKIAIEAGKSVQWAYMHFKLLSLPIAVQRLLEPSEHSESAIPLAMGTFLLTIPDQQIQTQIAEAVARGGLTVARAKLLARTLAVQAGIQAVPKRRTPRDDHKVVRRFIKNTCEGAENILEMPHRSLEDLYEHRPLADRQLDLANLDQVIELLQRLREGIRIKRPVSVA